MRIVIFNGSPRKKGNTAAMLRELADHYLSQGSKVDYYDLYDMDFKDCAGCLTCKREEVCAQRDELTPVYDKIREADVLVIGSPIYISAETATTKALVDRMYALLAPGKSQGQFISRLAPGKKGVVLFTCGNPQGNELFSPVTTRYRIMMERFGIEVKVIMVPELSPAVNVLETPRGQRALEDIKEHISK